jgi:hypothetical protein
MHLFIVMHCIATLKLQIMNPKRKYYTICLLSCLCLLFFITFEGLAEKIRKKSNVQERFEKNFEFLISGDILIKQGEQTSSIPLFKNKSAKTYLVGVTVHGEDAKLIQGTFSSSKVLPGNTFTLPIIQGSQFRSAEAEVIISVNNKKIRRIRVATQSPDEWKKLNSAFENDPKLTKGIIIKNKVFLIVDMAKIDPAVFNDDTGISIDTVEPDLSKKEMSLLKSNNISTGTQTINYGPDEQGITIHQKGLCYRRFDPWPLPKTRYSSGIVYWDKGNPSAQGYSIKDENNSSSYTSSLRCPKRVKEYDYSVDGVYKKT